MGHQEGIAVVVLVLVQLYCRRVWYDRMSFLKQHRVDHIKGPNLSAAPEVIDWCAWASNIDMSGNPPAFEYDTTGKDKDSLILNRCIECLFKKSKSEKAHKVLKYYIDRYDDEYYPPIEGQKENYKKPG